MSVVLFVCVGLMSPSTMARIHLNEGPLFSTATSFTLELTTTTLTKQTPCYITSGDVSQCRRKRGIEESPQISDIIASSAVVGYIRQTKNFLFLILNYWTHLNVGLKLLLSLVSHVIWAIHSSVIIQIKKFSARLTTHITATLETFCNNWRLEKQVVIMTSRSVIAACRRWISANSFPVWVWMSNKRQHWRPLLRKRPPTPVDTPQWPCWVALRLISLILPVRWKVLTLSRTLPTSSVVTVAPHQLLYTNQVLWFSDTFHRP